VREELWPRAKEYQISPFWSFLYGVVVCSLSDQAPEWLQLNTEWQRMSASGYPQFVPFLRVVTDPDPYCFTASQQIVIWRHESPEEPEEVSQTFSEVLMREIRELEDRKARKLRGEDKRGYEAT